MDQISINTPKKKTVNITNIETLVKITNTEKLVNSINLDPFKYPGPQKSHTLKKTVSYMDLKTKV